MFKFIFKKALKIPKIESLETYLFVGPHPDDIEISCGATIAKLRALNKKVVFLIATDGSVGSIDQSIDSSSLIEIRKKEAIESGKVLHVDDVRFLPFHDGDDYDLKEMQASIAKEIIDIKPDIVFLPDPNVSTEFHADHLNVARATINAIMTCNWKKINERMKIDGMFEVKNVALYYTSKVNTIVNVKKYVKQKFEAVRCHKSQFTSEAFDQLEMYFKLSGLRLGLKKFCSFAEGYRVLTSTHMHCFPEGDIYF